MTRAMRRSSWLTRTRKLKPRTLMWLYSGSTTVLGLTIGLVYRLFGETAAIAVTILYVILAFAYIAPPDDWLSLVRHARRVFTAEPQEAIKTSVQRALVVPMVYGVVTLAMLGAVVIALLGLALIMALPFLAVLILIGAIGLAIQYWPAILLALLVYWLIRRI